MVAERSASARGRGAEKHVFPLVGGVGAARWQVAGGGADPRVEGGGEVPIPLREFVPCVVLTVAGFAAVSPNADEAKRVRVVIEAVEEEAHNISVEGLVHWVGEGGPWVCTHAHQETSATVDVPSR
jgi:hypothetical protein